MRCQFSEIQFMFALMHELCGKLKPSGGWLAPCFPTQIEENDLGYDCCLSGSVRTLFFQFKVPEKKTRSNALYWNDFYTSYYQFKLWPHDLSPQHNNLVTLANADPRHNVFYCSPAFIERSEYSAFYQRQEIAKNSIYIPCRNLPQIQGMDQHHICYTLHPRQFVMHSDPVEVIALDFDDFLVKMQQSERFSSLESLIHHLTILLSEVDPLFENSVYAENRYTSNFRLSDSPYTRYRHIANYLLKSQNIHLLVF